MSQEKIQFDAEAIDKELEQIAQDAKTVYNSNEYKKLAFSLIDLTTLNSTDTETSVRKFTEKVNSFPDSFPDMPNVAAICVYPNMVNAVEQTLDKPDVNIASVSGGFPSSMTFTPVKVEETKMALEAGADEIDIVLALSLFMDEKYQQAHDDIAAIKSIMGKSHLKVILETGALVTPEQIWKASVLAINAGADFIKTSTGKMNPAATPLAAYVMCTAIAWHYEQTGEKIGFKAAGGISTSEDALMYVSIVKHVLGDEWLSPDLFRLGASRLANNLLTDIEKKPVQFF